MLRKRPLETPSKRQDQSLAGFGEAMYEIRTVRGYILPLWVLALGLS